MTTTFQDLQSVLSACLSDENLRLQVNHTGSQLSVVINRLNDTAVNYEDTAETLVAKLRSLNLPNVNAVKLYGRPANSKQLEWQTSCPLVTEIAKPVISKSSVIDNGSSQKVKSKFQGYLEQFSHYSNVISAASLLSVLLLLVGFTTLASQRMQEERIEKKRIEEKVVVWEYQIKNVGDTSFTEEMNQQGELGWDLVFARRAKDSGDTFAYECIFKRVKK